MSRLRFLPLVAAVLVAACQATPPAAPVAAAQAPVAGRASLTIAPTFTGGAARRLLEVIAPWSDTSIDHLVVKLHTVTGEPGDETLSAALQTLDIGQDELYNAFSFTNLNFATKYRVMAYAYKAAGTATDDLISEYSAVDLPVAMDDRPLLANLVVQLKDRTFSGEATSAGLTVNEGQVVHDGQPAGAVLHHALDVTHVNTIQYSAPGSIFRMASNAAGEAFYTDTASGKVYKVAANGDTSEFATGIQVPASITFGPDGTMYVGGYGGVWKVAADGSKTLLAGSASVNGNHPTTGGTEADPLAARFDQVIGLAVEANGDLIVADYGNDVLRKVTQAGVVSDLTDRTTFQSLQGLTRGRDGKYYVADQGLRKILKVTTAGVISDFAGDGAVANDDGPVASASFGYPNGGLVFDRAGWLYVADGFTVRRIDAAGRNVETVAGYPAGPGAHVDGSAFQAPGDYGNARFVSVTGLTVLPNGEVLVGDSTRIRRLFNLN